MKALTINIREEQAELLEELSGDDGEYESKSDAVRSFIDGYEEVDRLRAKVERLENEKQMILSQREENSELIEYVEEEREIERQRQRKENAPVWRRAKYWIFGFSEND